MSAAHDAIRIFAPAKINWLLTIERKREDGFHDLHTVFQTLSWGDTLSVRPLDEPCCRISADDPAVPVDESNLIARAWRLLREAAPERVGGVAVDLTKRIPMGAGLGGGSADAAAALVGINHLYQLGLKRSALETMAARLGSDCAFFIRGGTALGTGRGERLQPVANHLPNLWLVVVHPGFHSSTARAYQQIRPEHWQDGTAAAGAARAIAAGDLPALQEWMRNVFEPVMRASEARYAQLQEWMERVGLQRPMLSGSGSAMFAFAAHSRQAREACRRLAAEAGYPVAVAVRPRRTGVRVITEKATGPGVLTADHRPSGRFLQKRGREHV